MRRLDGMSRIVAAAWGTRQEQRRRRDDIVATIEAMFLAPRRLLFGG